MTALTYNSRKANSTNPTEFESALEDQGDALLFVGRKKKNNNISRLIDIDILDFKGKIINHGLILPHPRMHCRKFVLNPMKKIAPSWKHPVYKKNIDFLIAKIKSHQILIKK